MKYGYNSSKNKSTWYRTYWKTGMYICCSKYHFYGGVSYGAESKYGAEIPLTTIGITMKVNQIVSAILLGLATGAQPIFGYNYGSGQKDRVKQVYRIILAVFTIVLILAFLVFQFAPMSIVRLFGSESELYNEFAVKCFKIFLLACPINGLQMATGIFFQAIGKPTHATILSLSRQIVYLLPATHGILRRPPDQVPRCVAAKWEARRGVKSGANSDKPTAHKMSWAIF